METKNSYTIPLSRWMNATGYNTIFKEEEMDWDFTGGNTISPYNDFNYPWEYFDLLEKYAPVYYSYYFTGTKNKEEVMKHEFNLAGTKKEDIAIKWFKSNGMFRVYVKEEMFAYRTLNNGDTIDHVTYDEGLLTVHLKKEDPVLVKVE